MSFTTHQPYPTGGLESLFDGAQSNPIRYLHDYLRYLNATSILVETDYVDRHHLEDFANHYARSFKAHRAKCARLHFFEEVTDDELREALTAAHADEPSRAKVEARLQPHYLGFVVKRRLPGAEVGRTVLRTYPPREDNKFRQYDVVRPYRVNVAGLQLSIDGLAYQQQDGAAAVCASTALWFALQQVARLAGHRTPTPSAITAAAGSPFPPSQGLSYRDMANAIARLGYAADQFTPGANRELFRAKVITCLESHLPVILILTRRQQASEGESTGPDNSSSAHAVTLTGFRRPASAHKVPLPRGALSMRGGRAQVVYVHDDNLGSHAHYEFWDSPLVEGLPGDPTDERSEPVPAIGHNGHAALMLHRGSRDAPPSKMERSWWTPDDWVVDAALVPKPEKLRMSLDNLYAVAVGLRRIVSQCLNESPVEHALRYDLGVTYLRGLIREGFEPVKLADFHLSVTLPRHIAVVSVYWQGTDTPLFDFVLDATDVVPRNELACILAVVARGIPEKSFPYRVLSDYCAKDLGGCPLIAGPPARSPGEARARLHKTG